MTTAALDGENWGWHAMHMGGRRWRDCYLVRIIDWVEDDPGKFIFLRRGQIVRLPIWSILGVAILAAVLIPLGPINAEATVYGCSIAGQWQCYPSPKRCYKNTSYLNVAKYSSYAACQSRKPAQRKKK